MRTEDHGRPSKELKEAEFQLLLNEDDGQTPTIAPRTSKRVTQHRRRSFKRHGKDSEGRKIMICLDDNVPARLAKETVELLN